MNFIRETVISWNPKAFSESFCMGGGRIKGSPEVLVINNRQGWITAEVLTDIPASVYLFDRIRSALETAQRHGVFGTVAVTRMEQFLIQIQICFPIRGKKAAAEQALRKFEELTKNIGLWPKSGHAFPPPDVIQRTAVVRGNETLSFGEYLVEKCFGPAR